MKRIILLAIITMAFMVSCNQPEKVMHTQGWDHTVTVNKVIQTTNYTYLEVQEGEDMTWIAIPKGEYTVGQTVYYNSGLTMANFESKELNRTFDKVLFVQVISTEPQGEGAVSPRERASVNKSAGEQKAIEIVPMEGGLTLADVFAQKDELNGKVITVKGQVTKYNPAILNKNWLHIQDGTKSGEYYDLTITTTDESKVGEVVTFTGTLNLNRDFGAGYTYDIILEDAKKVE